MINHQLLGGSNASDLLNKAVNANTKIQLTPGWDDFQKYIQSVNFPQILLSKSLKQELAKAKIDQIDNTATTEYPKTNKRGKDKKSCWNPY